MLGTGSLAVVAALLGGGLLYLPAAIPLVTVLAVLAARRWRPASTLRGSAGQGLPPVDHRQDGGEQPEGVDHGWTGMILPSARSAAAGRRTRAPRPGLAACGTEVGDAEHAADHHHGDADPDEAGPHDQLPSRTSSTPVTPIRAPATL